jgi:hypothetical protein
MIVGLVIFTVGLPTLEGKGLPPEGATLAKTGRFGLPNGLVLIVAVALSSLGR